MAKRSEKEMEAQRRGATQGRGHAANGAGQDDANGAGQDEARGMTPPHPKKTEN